MLRGFGLVTAVLSAAVRLATAAAAQEPAVSLFDTGSPSADPLPPEAIALRQGWTAIPEGGKPAPFKGDAVLANGQVALVIRGKAPAAELYSRQGSGYALRSRLAPALPGGGTPSAVASLGVADNAADAAAVRAAYRLAGGADASVVFSVSAGLPAVKAQPGAGLDGLRIEAPCRLVVVPDFFADDIVLDAPAIPTDRAEAPADNFLMMMLGAGEAIVTAIWDKAGREPELTLGGQGRERAFTAAHVFHGGGAIWVAVLEGRGIWHGTDVTAGNEGPAFNLSWGPPFRAKWKADLPAPGGGTDSWDMMWHPANRGLWATAIGHYTYPVWIDGKETNLVGHVELGKPAKPEQSRKGPIVIYPADRTDKTPVASLTVTDLLRNCMGVGPCEYIMDVAGQASQSRGLYTCATHDLLTPVFKLNRQKEERQYVAKTLDDVLVFVMAIRNRIESFVKWGQNTRAWLAAQKQEKPQLAAFVERIDAIVAELDTRYARKKGAATADVAGWIAAYKPLIASDAGAARGAELVLRIRDGVGSPQDDLVGECRIVVKKVRQAAALAAATEPAAAEVARELRRRTHEILRSRMGHEGR